MGKQITRRLSWGAAAWVLNIQYFIVQMIVASAWHKNLSYSWANNTISDLANTHCGQYGARLVCSPLHTVMNISFLVVGLTIIGGAALLEKQPATNSVAWLGYVCMGSAGLGSLLVGLFPENSVSLLHVTGAALSFLLGNAGMILLGISLRWLPKSFRVYTIFAGCIGLIALPFFLSRMYLGLGAGGMERLVAYPQTIWMITFGAYLLSHRHLSRLHE